MKIKTFRFLTCTVHRDGIRNLNNVFSVGEQVGNEIKLRECRSTHLSSYYGAAGREENGFHRLWRKQFNTFEDSHLFRHIKEMI